MKKEKEIKPKKEYTNNNTEFLFEKQKNKEQPKKEKVKKEKPKKKKLKLKIFSKKNKNKKVVPVPVTIQSKERIKYAKERRKKEKLRQLSYTNQKTIVRTTPKKVSKLFIAFLGILAIIIGIGCYFAFGKFIAAGFLFIFIVGIIFTQILDNSASNSKLRKVTKSLCLIVIVTGIIGIIAFIIFFIFIAISSPEFDVSNLERSETTLVYDKDNNLIATLGTEKREKVTYDEIPEILIDAIIATEDSRFFQHNGFDAPRFIKAALGQVLGRDAGGASTITMQVAKNNFNGNDVTITRKFKDIYLSIFKIERAFTKQEIIEFYVNEPYLGSSSYGIEQASQTYFNKPAKDMTLTEAALIAGLFQAPGEYDPNINPDSAHERREVVLNLMVRHGYITQEEADIANAISIESLLNNTSSVDINPYQSYIDLAIDEIESKTGLDAYVYPMIIYTNMNQTKQKSLNNVFNGTNYTWPNSTVDAGVAAIESTSGKIIAIAGGRNIKVERGFSFATDINRQIGSTAKPLFDYGPGFEFNNWSTAKIFDDKRVVYGGSYMTNYDGRYKGKISLRESLRDSRNVPALLAFREVNNSQVKQFVTSLGIEPEIDSNGWLHEAHAVGAFNGSNPLTMAGAYASFSNGGYYYEPYAVNKIILRDSNEELVFKSAKTKVMSDSTAYMITDILQQVASDIGVRSAAGTPVATKTGTTNYDDKTRAEYGYPYSSAPDGWIAGYTTNISMVLWTGYIENTKGVYFTQSSMASHRNNLYKACAKAVFDRNSGSFSKPSSVVSVTIEKGSTLLPSEWTPASEKITELFKRGTEPTEISKKYIPVSDVTGLTIAHANGKVTLSWNAVAEPTDLGEARATFGDFGYFISKNGTFIEFIKESTYEIETTDPYGTYTVITGFFNNTFNRSLGISVNLNSPTTFTYNGSETLNLNIGDTYVELAKPITVYHYEEDVTTNAVISKSIVDSTGTIVDTIDTSKTGTFVVSYIASYNGQTSNTYTRTITIE